jgi:hypothetical protein
MKSNKKRYIFLDVDGVLNHPEWYQRIRRERGEDNLSDLPMNVYHMDPVAVQRLNQLKGAEVIISSSWGYDDETIEGLKQAGLELPIIGGINHIEYAHSYICRGNAIAKWFEDKYNHIPWDYLFDRHGWYNTHVTYGGTIGDMINGTEERVVHDDNIKISYVIIDDDADMLIWQQQHFIHVNRDKGLTDKDIERAKEILNIK